MTQYYVATTGNDTTGTGSSAAPWATITKAGTVVVAGDTVNVRSGTYTGTVSTSHNGTAAAPIVYKSVTKWGAVLVGTGSGAGTSCWVNSIGNYVEIRDFDISTSGSGGIYTEGSHNIIDGNYIHDILCTAIGTNTGLAIDGIGDYNIMSNNVVRNVAAGSGSTAVQGLYIAGRYWQCYNNLVSNVAYFGIHCWHGAGDAIIANNTVFNCGQGILIGSGDSGALPGGNQNNLVRNNIVFNNGLNGIAEQGPTDLNTYDSNLVFGNSINWNLGAPNIHTNDVTADPLFVNYLTNGTGDYRLQSASPAIGAGTSLSAPLTDLVGTPRPRNNGIDIGCYQFIETQTGKRGKHYGHPFRTHSNKTAP